MIGVVGGGQLARMLVQAAASRQIPVAVQTGSDDDPAVEGASRLVTADPRDVAGTRQLVVVITRRAMGSLISRRRLAKPTNCRGSLTSRPVVVKLMTSAMTAGMRTDRLIRTKAGSRKAQAVRLLRMSPVVLA